MIAFAEKQLIIAGYQHGLVKGQSTVTNLLTCLNDWTTILVFGQPLVVIYLDYSKAFDKVPHHLLIFKLEKFGIRGPLLKWIK